MGKTKIAAPSFLSVLFRLLPVGSPRIQRQVWCPLSPIAPLQEYPLTPLPVRLWMRLAVASHWQPCGRGCASLVSPAWQIVHILRRVLPRVSPSVLDSCVSVPQGTLHSWLTSYQHSGVSSAHTLISSSSETRKGRGGGTVRTAAVWGRGRGGGGKAWDRHRRSPTGCLCLRWVSLLLAHFSCSPCYGARFLHMHWVSVRMVTMHDMAVTVVVALRGIPVCQAFLLLCLASSMAVTIRGRADKRPVSLSATMPAAVLLGAIAPEVAPQLRALLQALFLGEGAVEVGRVACGTATAWAHAPVLGPAPVLWVACVCWVAPPYASAVVCSRVPFPASLSRPGPR
jgi:hypothetical protein